MSDPFIAECVRTVYDTRSGLVLLWGGRDGASNPSADLWAWNGAAWYNVTTDLGSSAAPESLPGFSANELAAGTLVFRHEPDILSAVLGFTEKVPAHEIRLSPPK